MARSRAKETGAVIDLADMGIGVTKFSDSKEAVITDYIPTGLPNIDFIIGSGIPFGRLTEIYGVNSSGKSTIAVLVSKIAQTMAVDVVWIDVEGTLETKRLKQLGLDPSKNLYLIKPNEPKKGVKATEADGKLTVEEVGEHLKNLVEASAQTGRRMIIIWDSVGATPTKAQFEQGMEGKQLGLHAKAVTQLATLIGQDISESSVAFIAINQARDKIGSFMGGIDSGGGNAFKHWATLRLQINRGSAEAEAKINAFGKQESIRSTYTSKIKVVKSKISIPNREGEFILIPEIGVNLGVNYFELLSKPSKYGALTRSGAYYQYVTENGEQVSFYKDDWITMLNNPETPEHLALVQELVQKMYITSFPDWYPPLDNEVIDIEANPVFKGLRARYEALHNQEVTTPVAEVTDTKE